MWWLQFHPNLEVVAIFGLDLFHVHCLEHGDGAFAAASGNTPETEVDLIST
jgi:hypothetical protein